MRKTEIRAGRRLVPCEVELLAPHCLKLGPGKLPIMGIGDDIFELDQFFPVLFE